MAGCKNHRRKCGYYHVELVQGPVHASSTRLLCLVILRLLVAEFVFREGGAWISSVFGGQLERKYVLGSGPGGKLQILPSTFSTLRDGVPVLR